MNKYAANIEFSLNFEEPKGLSIRIRPGDIIFFDGVTAKYINKTTGKEESGKTTSLNAAIRNNWLSLANTKSKNVPSIRVNDGNIVEKKDDYNPLTGGSFDSFLNHEKNKMEVVREDERVVKKTSFNARPVLSDSGEGKNQTRPSLRKSTIIVTDGVSINKVEKAAVEQFDQNMDAKVVKKIDKIVQDEVTESEGVILKKTVRSSDSNPVDFSGVKSQQEVNEIEKNIPAPSDEKKENKNYIDMLPDNWSKLHWIKKGKFIMTIDDIEFLKFIMKMENAKAIQEFCKKRMMELAKVS